MAPEKRRIACGLRQKQEPVIAGTNFEILQHEDKI
jgi:hypothetical protein